MNMEGAKVKATITLQNSTQEPSPDVTTVDLKFVKLCVYVVIFILSVAGNTLVILSVLLFDKMKVVPNLFIANLAACDLTTTLFSIPFDLVEAHLGFFPYGREMCSVLWPLATWSTNSAALTLVAISCDRYLTIIHPLNFNIRITKRRYLKIIALLHLVSFAAVLPYAFFLRYTEEEETVPSCDEEWPDGAPYSKIYTFVLFVLQYAVPLLVMSVIYIRLGISLFKNTKDAFKLSGTPEHLRTCSMSKKRKHQNEKITKMFLIVVVIFLIFMMPHQVLFLFYDYADSEVLTNRGNLVNLICRAFTYTNAVLNAVIYGACNRSFRVTFKSIAKCNCSKAHQRDALKISTSESPKRKDNITQPVAVPRCAVIVKTITDTTGTNSGKPADLCQQSSEITSDNKAQVSTTQDCAALCLDEAGLLLKRLCQECEELTDSGNEDTDNSNEIRETRLSK